MIQPWLGAEGQSRQHVGTEVHGQNLWNGERQRHGEEPETHVRNDLRHVAGEDVRHELSNIGIDGPSFFDGVDDGRKIIVCQHHFRRALAHVRAGDAHRHADVRLFERGRIVHAVPGHGNDLTLRLQNLHQPQFVLWRIARKHGCFL